MHEDIRGKISLIHAQTKKLTLRAEEFDSEQEFFFPPVIQQRDAYDHIIRSEVAALNLKQFDSIEAREKYQRDNLDKALGHEYRAFFDIADWLAILYREKMIALSKKYSHDCIDGVLKNYYTEIVPFLEGIHRGIAEIREKKDIAIGDSILAEVLEYGKLLDKLDDYWRQIAKAESALRLRQASLRKSKFTSYLIKLTIGLFLALVGWFLGRRS